MLCILIKLGYFRLDREQSKTLIMKKLIILLLTSITLIACGGTQKATHLISTGNYVNAFNVSIEKLTKDKSSKTSQKHIPVLKEAYIKAAETDIRKIANLKNTKTPKTLKKIYGTYLNLDLRQDEVRVLQPLYIEGSEVSFLFDDYTDEISTAKENYSASLYNLAMKELKGDKLAARDAYKHLEALIYTNPTYKNNLTQLSQNAKNKGSSFVLVILENNSNAISKDSISDLTKINSGNFDNQWVQYHPKKDDKVKYDYLITIELNKLTFVPKKTNQETVSQEAKVQDGWQYQLDASGNVMKDDKGNDIKIAKYKVVKAEIALFQQNKASKLDGFVVIKSLKTNKQVSKNPMFGEAKFQHVYGKYRGDQRAIEQKYFDVLKAKELAYPQDYEFVKYSVSNFKQKVTTLLAQQQF
jgi:hypothetical protein